MDDPNLNNTNTTRKSQKGKKLSASDNYQNTTNTDDHEKKLMHREIEKQRRQEMSTLHASLRSLLPLEYIKGKRSMSDHMDAAMNYVKDLKNNINELSSKRDELKNLSDLDVNPGSVVDESGSRNNSTVMVHPCFGGLEVVISCGFREQGLVLSSVLQVLVDEGLDVASCVSTEVNQISLLTIHIEASHLTSMDISELKQKLAEVINP